MLEVDDAADLIKAHARLKQVAEIQAEATDQVLYAEQPDHPPHTRINVPQLTGADLKGEHPSIRSSAKSGNAAGHWAISSASVSPRAMPAPG